MTPDQIASVKAHAQMLIDKDEETARLRAALEAGLEVVRNYWTMTGPESEPEKSTLAFINQAEAALRK